MAAEFAVSTPMQQGTTDGNAGLQVPDEVASILKHLKVEGTRQQDIAENIKQHREGIGTAIIWVMVDPSIDPSDYR